MVDLTYFVRKSVGFANLERSPAPGGWPPPFFKPSPPPGDGALLVVVASLPAFLATSMSEPEAITCETSPVELAHTKGPCTGRGCDCECRDALGLPSGRPPPPLPIRD